jgi:hypothetical protein
MTDPHLDRLVRDADPYRPEAVGRVGAARAEPPEPARNGRSSRSHPAVRAG